MVSTQFVVALTAASAVRNRAKVLARADRELKSDLVACRRAAGLTQKQVAELMGVTQQAIHKLERYDSDPKLSTLRRYANAVGALVQHHVTVDVGQSVRLAADSGWKDVAAVKPVTVSANTGSMVDLTGWGLAKRTDFGLAV